MDKIIKKCANYPGYGTDEDGNVYSFYLRGQRKSNCYDYNKTPFMLKQYIDFSHNKPRTRVKITVNKIGSPENVSRLVADAWVLKKDPTHMWVLHKNDIATDNKASNLEWGSPKINHDQRVENLKNDRTIARLEEELAKYKQLYGELK